MATIKATVQHPPTISVAWSHNGQPAGQQQVTPLPVSVTRVVSDPENWTAVANWSSGQDTADVSIEQ